jgi:uroporphyrinogen III methyltransferase/synthase
MNRDESARVSAAERAPAPGVSSGAASDAMVVKGIVWLVGAGPGDPGLLTRRGAEVLAQAEVVVHDRLANAALLDLAPASAQRISVGKAPGRVELDQEGINALLVEHGSAGRRVVRLKGGDPFVFGRGGEEAEALIAAGVPFEVVPGITSAIAAPAYAGIPVTHRGLSTHVTIVTGHEDPAKGRADVDWDALGRAGGTLVILMGAAHVAELAAHLMAAGRAPDTPVAAVRNGTRPDQRTVRATLATIGDAGVRSPAAIVVGDVAALDLSWFETRPLFGRRVVVTRAREQASELRVRLEALGAEVLELPSIRVEPVDFELPALDRYAWLVCTSANGVGALFDRGFAPRGLDARALGGVRVGAIGPGTAAAFRSRGITPDLVPDRFVAESLVDAFPAPRAPGERVLLARAEVARDVLPEGLGARGYEVEVLTVYRTVRAEPDEAELAAVRAGEVDAITFTSSSTVEHFGALVATLPDPQPLVVSIGPVTSATARTHGLRVDAEASEHTIRGLVSALVAALAVDPRPT